MGPYIEPHILSWICFTPLLTALLLLASRAVALLFFGAAGAPGVVWRAMAMAGTSFTFLLALYGLTQGYDPELTQFQLVERAEWIPELGVRYFVGVDGISLVLVLLTTFVVPLALLSSWSEVNRSLKSFVTAILFIETGILGVLVSLNVFQLYLFAELALIASFFLVTRWGGVRRQAAATKFLLYGLASSLLMLLGMLVVFRMNLEQGGAPNFDMIALEEGAGLGFLATAIPMRAEAATWWQSQTGLFLVFALSFGIRAPLFPVHGWLADALAEAPTAGSVLLGALLLKLGLYQFIRIVLPLFPEATRELAPFIFWLALLGILYGALLALAERDIKRLVIFFAFAHVGFASLGLFTLELHAVVGAVVHMVSQGLCVAALFVVVGLLGERRGTRRISAYGGLVKPMPICAAFLALAVFGAIGIPSLSGFVGELLILIGTFERHPIVAVVSLLGVALCGVALFTMFRRVMFGELARPENRGLIDLELREGLLLLAALLPVVWIGLHPNPLLRRVEPSVSMLLRGLEARPLESESARGAAAAEASDEEAGGAPPGGEVDR